MGAAKKAFSIKPPETPKVGGFLGQYSEGTKSLYGNIMETATGKKAGPFDPPKIEQTTLTSSTPQRDKATSEAEARNAALAASLAASQAQRNQATTPQMTATMMDRSQVGNIGAQQTGPGTAVGMDVSGVQRVNAQTGARMDTSGINAVISRDTSPMTAERFARESVQNAVAQGSERATAAQIQTADQAQARQQQLALAEQLQAQAAGTAPSIAEMQAKKAGERALAAQLAMQAGQAGSAAPLAQRTAARQQAAIGADIAGQSAVLRLQEQQAAQKALGELAGQMRTQDISLASQQAQLQQATNLANLQASAADVDRQLRANLANQGVDLDVLKANAAAGNQAAIANLQAATQNADRDVRAQMANQATMADIAKTNLQAQVADMDRNLRASLANQGVDLDKAKMDAANGNAMALANLSVATQNADRLLKADMANQGVDLDVLKANAAAGNAAAQANLVASIQKMGLDDAMTRAYLQNQLDLNKQQTDQVMQSIAIQSQENMAQARLDQERRLAKAGAAGQQQGGLMSAGGALGAAAIAASDRDLKMNITPDKEEEEKKKKKQEEKDKETRLAFAEALRSSTKAFQKEDKNAEQKKWEGITNIGEALIKKNAEGETETKYTAVSDKKDKTNKSKQAGRLTNFLDNLEVYSYDYKDPAFGKGRQTSVMAQDLEKSEIGKKAIIDTPVGKMVDYSKLMPAMLAANVDAHHRIATLEEALKAKKGKK